ncbi:MAG: redoxin domain-containing protein [Flavisolibacter sp.]
MKKIIPFTLAMLFFTGACFSQPDGKHFSIKGKINGQEDGFVVLSYPFSSGKMIKDTSWIKNGSFEFNGKLEQPVMASLTGKVQTRSVSDPNYTTFFIEPGIITIDIEKDHFKDGKYSGSSIQKEYLELDKSKRKVEAKYRVQLDSLRTEKDHDKNAEIRERLAPYFAEMDQADYDFFKKHPQSYVTAYMLRYHVSDLSLKDLEHYYNQLGTKIQQTTFAKDIDAEIVKLRGGSPGSMAKGFSATDINGNELRLTDYKGKYVLLDFWASWCVPCRKGNPHLKELYAKYKDKGIEFIGIADDDRAEDAWRKAVDKDGIGMWKHIRRGLKYSNGEYDRSNDISENFGIHTLPTKILIDPEGKIVGRYSEEEEPLNKKLKDIFGE